MKKSVFTILLIASLSSISLAQESKFPYHVRNFLEEYGSSLDEFLNAEELNRSFGFNQYFLNIQDTLFWPDNFDLEDLYYKHRLGPKEYYQRFSKFKNKSSMDFIYSFREMGEIKHVKTKTTRFYDIFRVKATDNHIFSNTEYGQKDSTVAFSNYYDIVSWFNPRTSLYEFRINKIYESQTASRFTPQSWQAGVSYLQPRFRNNTDLLSASSGYGLEVKANWLLGGKGTINYLFRSGLGLSGYRFKLENRNFFQSNNQLTDQDGCPFRLLATVNDLSQNLSFQMITLPVLFQATKYFLNGKFSTGVYGGMNISLPVNVRSDNSEGSVTYSGKYKFDLGDGYFDFDNDSIILENLEPYHYTTYKVSDLPRPAPKLSTLLFSAELGGEFNWYLGKRIVATASVSYLKSLNPIYRNEQHQLAYNVAAGEKGENFAPALNSFLALNGSNYLDLLKIGVGLNFIIEKPVIPHGRVGYAPGAIRKIVRNDLVLSSGSFNQNSKAKELNLIVNGVSTGAFGARIEYRYVGPSSKFYRQGRLSSGSNKENHLSLLVPESNTGTKLFLEEPYGYNLKVEGVEPGTGGLYNEIKVLSCSDIWQGTDTRATLNLNFERLNPLNIFLIDYKFSFDNLGAHREKIMSELRNAVSQALSNRQISVIYILSDQPEAYFIDSEEQMSEIFERLEIKLQDTDEVSTNVEGLQNFINSRSLNPRRDINLALFTSEEFLKEGYKAVVSFPGVLNIDSGSVTLNSWIQAYNTGLQSDDFDNLLNAFRKIGKIHQ